MWLVAALIRALVAEMVYVRLVGTDLRIYCCCRSMTLMKELVTMKYITKRLSKTALACIGGAHVVGIGLMWHLAQVDTA